jgi:hypothetical protein
MALTQPRYRVSEHPDGRYGVWDTENDKPVRRRHDFKMIAVMYPEVAQVIADSLNQEWLLGKES